MKKAKKEWIILSCATLLLGAVWLFTHDNPLRRRFMPLTVIISEQTVDDLYFSPDGSMLAISGYTSADSTVPGSKGSRNLEVFNLSDLSLKWSTNEFIYLKGFSPDGRFLMTYSNLSMPIRDSNGQVIKQGLRFWDSASGQKRHELPGLHTPNWLNANQIISGSHAGTLEDWNVAQEKRIKTIARQRRIPDFTIGVNDAKPSPQGRYILGIIKHWRHTFYSGPNIKPQPNVITGPVRVWDAKSGKVLAEIGSKQVWQAVFGSDDTTILTCEGPEVGKYQCDATLTWWDWPRRQKLRAIKIGPVYGCFISPKRDYILCTRFLEDGPSEASRGSVWQAFDLKSGRRLWSFRTTSTDELTLRFSQDGTLFCVAERHKTKNYYQGVVRSGKSGRELARFENARYLALSADGKRLACGETDGGPATLRHDHVRIHDLSRLKP